MSSIATTKMKLSIFLWSPTIFYNQLLTLANTTALCWTVANYNLADWGLLCMGVFPYSHSACLLSFLCSVLSTLSGCRFPRFVENAFVLIFSPCFTSILKIIKKHIYSLRFPPLPISCRSFSPLSIIKLCALCTFC